MAQKFDFRKIRVKTWWNRSADEKKKTPTKPSKPGEWAVKLGKGVTSLALWLYYNPLLQVLFILGLFVALNFFALRFFYRVDVTRYDTYTFSPAIKKTVQGLTEPLTIKLFLSSDLPAGINNIPEEIKDYYIELQRINPGKVKIEQFDPSTTTDAVTTATEYSISPIQYADPQGNRATVGTAYLGVGFDYKDQKSSIPEVRASSDLELQTLLLIRKFVTTEKKTIGMVTGHQELNLSVEFPQLDNWLKEQFQPEMVNLADLKSLTQYPLLVVLAPQADYSAQELMVLDQYILNGGRVLFIMEGFIIADDQQAAAVNTNVFDLLKSYGVGYEKGLLMDKSYNPFVAQGLPLEYPYWLRIPSKYLNEGNGVFRQTQSMNVAWAIALKPELGRYKDIAQPNLVPLAQTTEEGALYLGETIPIALDQTFSYANTGQRVLSYEVSGNLLGHFEGSKSKAKTVPLLEKQLGKDFKYQSSSDKGKFIVIGDSDFLLDRSQFGLPSNVDVFLRMIYWGLDDQEMLTLKTPVIQIPWSRTVTDQQIQWFKAGNFVGVGLLLVLSGVVVWVYSRRQKPRF